MWSNFLNSLHSTGPEQQKWCTYSSISRHANTEQRKTQLLATSSSNDRIKPEKTASTVGAENTFLISMLSGAAAGVAVDVSLFPIDTIKTRMQSTEGFFKAGGFRGIYNGIGAAALGSAPGAATFFTTYDSSKRFLEDLDSNSEYRPLIHMVAASIGEVFACLVRVPTENVKQKQQAGIYKSFSESIHGIRSNGGIRTFGPTFTNTSFNLSTFRLSR